MQIIVQGKSMSKRQWWESQLLDCHKCGCKFKLEPGDAVTSFQTYIRDNVRIVAHCEIICPTPGCISVIWFYEPGQEGAINQEAARTARLAESSVSRPPDPISPEQAEASKQVGDNVS